MMMDVLLLQIILNHPFGTNCWPFVILLFKSTIFDDTCEVIPI